MKKETIINNSIWKKISKNAIVEPIYMTTTYKQDSIEEWWEYLYTWWNNPNFKSLEYKLNSLENWSLESIIFPTGMSAISSVALALLEKWDEVICNNNTYIGTSQVFSEVCGRFGVKTNFVEMLDLDLVKKSITPNTKLIWIETPSNPLLKLYDIINISKIAKENNVIVWVDSSFLTSLNISPLELWADIVVQTTTKYLSWTSDTMWWLVSSNDKVLIDKVRRTRNIIGAFPSPMNAWLIERWLKTLFVRMKQIQENALYIASNLEKQGFVEKVIYPKLDSYEQKKLALKIIRWWAWVISVKLNLDYEKIKAGFSKFKLWNPSVSFWGTESLIDFPVYIWWKNYSKETKEMIWYNLVRLSVWIEDKDDLLDDFINAFSK